MTFQFRGWDTYLVSTKNRFPDGVKPPLIDSVVQVTGGRETEVLCCCPLVSFLYETHSSKKRSPETPADLFGDRWNVYKQELPPAGKGRRRGKGWLGQMVVDLKRTEV